MKARVAKTHPNRYWLIMCFAVMFAALAVNFHFFTPTFLVYGAPNYVWSACFLALSTGLFVFSNLWHTLEGLRLCLSLSVAFLLFFAAGTSEPFIHGEGSLQLPIVYLGLSALAFPVLIEPYVNPWTAARKANGKVPHG